MLELMEAALERARVLAPADAVADGLVPYLERHLVEEAHHDDPGGAILDDLAALGLDVPTLVEEGRSSATTRLRETQHGWIRDAHPVAVLGFLALETCHTKEPTVELLIDRTGLARSGFRQLLLHARLDAVHEAELYDVLDSLPLEAAHEELVGLSALTTLRLVAEALLETLDRAVTRLEVPA